MDKNDKLILHKLVYFDEGSATDYIQLVNGGEISVVEELLKDTNTEATGEISAGIKGKAGLLRVLLGVDASLGAAGKIEGGRSTHNVVKNIIGNTVLTDFIQAIDSDEAIKRFEGYVITPIENSLASFALMTPYLTMIRGGNISAGDFNLALEKLDSTIKEAKGYFEFLGTKGDKQDRCIFRFNNDSFKNNYSPNNLMRMDLTIYAIKVGSSTLEELDINNELNVAANQTIDNPDYYPKELVEDIDRACREERLDVYDVLLAGVGK